MYTPPLNTHTHTHLVSYIKESGSLVLVGSSQHVPQGDILEALILTNIII